MSGSEHSRPANALVRISVIRGGGAASRRSTPAREPIIVSLMMGLPVPIATKRTTPTVVITCPTATVIIDAATPLTIIIGVSVVSTRSAKRSLGIPWVIQRVRFILQILYRIHMNEFKILFLQIMISLTTVHQNTHMIPPVHTLFIIGIWDQIPSVYRKVNLSGDDKIPCILGIISKMSQLFP